MINIIPKIISVLLLSFFTVILFFIGTFPLIEGKFFLNKFIDTRFAKDYNPEKFDQVQVGMDINEAISLVGEPLRIHKVNSNVNLYIYTYDGKFRSELKDKSYYPIFFKSIYSDFAWYYSQFYVCSKGTVKSIDKGWVGN